MTGQHDANPSSEYKTEGHLIHWARLYHVLFGWYLSRTHEAVVALAGPKPGETVLDVCCGTGSLTLALKEAVGAMGSVHGIDASPEMIALARREARKADRKVDFGIGYAEKLLFDDKTFDLVISQLAIHHLPGDLKIRAFKEMHRVLKKNGRCVIIDFEPPPRWRSLWSFFHGREMMQTDVRQYETMMEAAGFSNRESGKTRHRMLAFIRARAAA